METVEFKFISPSSAAEETRTYEVDSYEEASRRFHEEFTDEKTRPKVFQVRVEHNR